MIKKFVYFLFAIIFVFVTRTTSAYATVRGSFFEPVPAPVTAMKLPVSASFVRLNPQIFRAAADWTDVITSIDGLSLDGKQVVLDVAQFEVLTKDATILLGTGAGDKPLTAPRHVMLRGTVRGEPNSHVYIAAFDGYAMGYIDIHHGDSLLHYLLQPMDNSGDAGSVMIAYRSDHDSAGSKWTCGAEEFAPNMPRIEKIANEIAVSEAQKGRLTPQSTTIRMLSIAIECDTTFYISHSSDTTHSISYALAVAGGQSDIYVRDLGTYIYVSFLRIWAHNDPFPGSTTSTQLGNLLYYWNHNMTTVQRAGTLLYTNRGGGGIAYVDVLCETGSNSYAYGVCGLQNNYTFPATGYVWDYDVSSHEFGHIVGSLHTFNCSWNPPIDSCVAAEGGTCYPTPHPVRGTIMSYCHLTSFGTELKFHARVIAFLVNNKLSSASCAANVEVAAAVAGPDKYFCGTDSVTLGGTPSGTSPFTYSWSPSTGLSSNTVQSPKAAPSSTTTYVLTLTDAYRMRSTDTVRVYVDHPSIVASNDVTACGVSTVAASATPSGISPFTYTWTDASTGNVIATTQNVSLPGTHSGTYLVHLTDSSGCGAVDSVHVYLDHPTVVASNDVRVCGVATVPATATPTGVAPFTYTWTDAAGHVIATTKNTSLPATQSATYLVHLTDSTGCSAVDSMHVFVTQPIVSAGGDVKVCGTASVNVTAQPNGIPPYSFTWTDATTGNIVSTSQSASLPALQSGTYYVHLTDSTGCSSMDSMHIFADHPTVTTSGDVTVCGVTSVPASAQPSGVPPFSYTWTDAATGAILGTSQQTTLPATQSGTYLVHVVDSVGCSAVDSMHVLVQRVPSAEPSVLGDSIFCQGGSTTIDAGPGFATYKWSTGATTEKITVTSAGTYYVIVTSADVGCADTSRTVSIVVNPLPLKPSISRSGKSLVASASANYQWYHDTVSIPGATAQVFVPTADGLYGVETSNVQGCTIMSDEYQYIASDVQLAAEADDAVKLFPNPAKESVTILNSAGELTSVVVSDVLGKEIMRMENLSGPMKSFVTMDVRTLAEGVYFVHYALSRGVVGTIRFVR